MASFHSTIITQLARNQETFRSLLEGLPKDQYLWKPAKDKWCLLEIVCHLLDEECEDFRARVKHCLEQPELPFTPIDPVAWVKDRDYIHQDYAAKVNALLKDRQASVQWLRSLQNPPWKNFKEHAILGPLSAELFLSNWLAHDYLHIRQMVQTKHAWLSHISEQDLTYAGNW